MFTSETLQVSSNLINLVSSRPNVPADIAGDFWDDLLASISKLINDALSGVVSGINETIQSIKDTITGIISPIVSEVSTAVSNVINGITGGIGDVIQGFINWIENAIGAISGWITQAIQSVESAVNSLGQYISDVYNDVVGWLSGIVEDIGAWISQAVNDVVTSVSDWLKQAYQDISGWINQAIVDVSKWIANTTSSIAEWINNAYNAVVATVEAVKTTVEGLISNLITWFQTTAENIRKFFWQTMSNIGTWIAKEVLPRLGQVTQAAQQLIAIFSKIWEKISVGDFAGAFTILDDLFKEAGIPAPISTLHSLVSAIAYFWETVRLQFVGLEVAAQKQAIINLGLEPVSDGSMASGVFRGVASIDQYLQNARLGGISADRARVALEANRNLPTPGQIQESFLRGEIDVSRHDHLLASYGLSPDNIELIKQLYLLIPGPSDLIRMAVREAFTPEIAERFGQYTDYPQAFTNWAAKIGLSKDWAERYWAAHWELPSPTMGFEMLHRGVIDNEELTLLLRALDVMPYWRERLIKISYNPLTRVDVRRMYQLGVIDQSQVTRAYLDLGYDQEKAEWLTQFTVRYYNPDDYNQQDEFKNLARSTYSAAFKKNIISEGEYRQFLLDMKYYPDDVELLISIDTFTKQQDEKLFDMPGYRKDWLKLILQAYDRGLIHQTEVTPMLIDLGYDQSEAELEISLSDYNRTLKLRNLVVSQVHDQYVGFIIDQPGLYNILDQFNFTPEETARLQEEWDIEKALRTKRPSLSDLRKFYAQKLISKDEFLDELRGEGYNEKYIDLYSASIG